jgi:hypothetical protein
VFVSNSQFCLIAGEDLHDRHAAAGGAAHGEPHPGAGAAQPREGGAGAPQLREGAARARAGGAPGEPAPDGGAAQQGGAGPRPRSAVQARGTAAHVQVGARKPETGSGRVQNASCWLDSDPM